MCAHERHKRTGGKIGNCMIRVVYKMRDENDNSGVFIRIPLEPREEWMPVHYGYEVQIDNHPETSKEDEYHETGMLYSLTKPLAKNAWKPGPEWNTMEITLDGTRTIVTLNDFSIVFIMTRGGPGAATHVFATYSYELGIQSQRWGLAMAASLASLPLVALLIVGVVRYLHREEE